MSISIVITNSIRKEKLRECVCERKKEGGRKVKITSVLIVIFVILVHYFWVVERERERERECV